MGMAWQLTGSVLSLEFDDFRNNSFAMGPIPRSSLRLGWRKWLGGGVHDGPSTFRWIVLEMPRSLLRGNLLSNVRGWIGGLFGFSHRCRRIFQNRTYRRPNSAPISRSATVSWNVNRRTESNDNLMSLITTKIGRPTSPLSFSRSATTASKGGTDGLFFDVVFEWSAPQLQQISKLSS